MPQGDSEIQSQTYSIRKHYVHEATKSDKLQKRKITRKLRAHPRRKGRYRKNDKTKQNKDKQEKHTTNKSESRQDPKATINAVALHVFGHLLLTMLASLPPGT